MHINMNQNALEYDTYMMENTKSYSDTNYKKFSLNYRIGNRFGGQLYSYERNAFCSYSPMNS